MLAPVAPSFAPFPPIKGKDSCSRLKINTHVKTIQKDMSVALKFGGQDVTYANIIYYHDGFEEGNLGA